MESPRLVQVIYGEGAGKTTMALGKAIRAHGNGLKVAVVQFMKPGTAWWEKENPVIGEVFALQQLGIQCYSYGREEFVYKPTSRGYELAKEAWDKATSLRSTMDVLVLDELLNAVSFGLIPEAEILEFIDNINGVGGFDRVVLSGNERDYTVQLEANGYQVDGPDGTKFLTSVQVLSFDGELLMKRVG